MKRSVVEVTISVSRFTKNGVAILYKLEIYDIYDISLHERTQLSVDEIIVLLKLCLSNTCFQWRDGFYEQTGGAAMGLPLSPVLANIFMEHFEQNALENSTYVPKLWKQFVDDISRSGRTEKNII